MDQVALLDYLAPCGLRCGDCLACARGEIGRLAGELRARLGNFKIYAERFASYDPTFADYPAFERMLNRFGAPSCQGCRAEGVNGCIHSACAVRPCARERGVDFCFQCAEFPCDRHGFPASLETRWRKSNERMCEIGVAGFFEEVRGTPRY